MKVLLIFFKILMLFAMQAAIHLQCNIVFIKNFFILTEFEKAITKKYSPNYVSIKKQTKHLKNTSKEAHISSKVACCNFSKNEHSYRFFQRALPSSIAHVYIVKFKNNIFQRCSQVYTSAKNLMLSDRFLMVEN